MGASGDVVVSFAVLTDSDGGAALPASLPPEFRREGGASCGGDLLSLPLLLFGTSRFGSPPLVLVVG